MDKPRILSAIVACALALSWDGLAHEQTQRDDLSSLIALLKDPHTSNDAAIRLEKLGKADPALHALLVKELRIIIANGSIAGKPPWLNSIHLAGELKLKDLSPELAAIIDRGPAVFMGAMRDEHPAAEALISIGDPALPALQKVAENGTTYKKNLAELAIWRIATPTARKALEAVLRQETDPKRKQKIQEYLDQWPEKSESPVTHPE